MTVAVMSHRPARAAERAPEALEVVDRNPPRPRARVIVAMDAAGAGAAAALRGAEPQRMLRLRRLLGLRLGPGAIAAIGAHRRPVGHRRGQRQIELLEV